MHNNALNFIHIRISYFLVCALFIAYIKLRKNLIKINLYCEPNQAKLVESTYRHLSFANGVISLIDLLHTHLPPNNTHSLEIFITL